MVGAFISHLSGERKKKKKIMGEIENFDESREFVNSLSLSLVCLQIRVKTW